jgi:arylsulfatase A-like enzyme
VRLLLSLLLLLPLAGVGCSELPAQSEHSRPNILLLSIDTLRADHLGCYGYARKTSPNLDRFAAQSVRYQNAFAPAPWTLPSHVAMLSGWHPYDAGIRKSRDSISPEVRLVSEWLQEAGYRTAAFVDSTPVGYLGARRGFGRGFESYAHAPHRGQGGARYIHDMAATVDATVGWLRAEEFEANRPFFLFLHTKSVHSTPSGPTFFTQSDAPYDKPEAYRTRFLPGGRMQFRWGEPPQSGSAHLLLLNGLIAKGVFNAGKFPPKQLEELIGLYDAGIYYTDEHFGRLLDGLRGQGLEQNTVVLVTSDHGEAFLDHRFFLHKELRPALLRVPLMIRDPRRFEPGVVEQRVELADLAPTILELAGIAPPEAMSGRVLPGPDAGAQANAGVDAREPRILFSYYRYTEAESHDAYALDDGQFKLIVREERKPQSGSVVELYDSRADPGERTPLAGEELRREALLAQLARRLEAPGATPSEPIELSDDERQRLRALGYLE